VSCERKEEKECVTSQQGTRDKNSLTAMKLHGLKKERGKQKKKTQPKEGGGGQLKTLFKIT